MAVYTRYTAGDLTDFQLNAVLSTPDGTGLTSFAFSLADGSTVRFSGSGITIQNRMVTAGTMTAGERSIGGTKVEDVVGAPGDTAVSAASIQALLAGPPLTRLDMLSFLLGGADLIKGSAFNDLLVGGAGADTIDGGAGFDIVTYGAGVAAPTAGITANLAVGMGLGGTAEGDRYIGIEGVIGTSLGDVLVGTAGVANRLDGGAGDDTIYAEGLDTVIGGAGIDVLFGAPGTALSINLANAGIEVAWGGYLGDLFDGSSSSADLILVGQGPTADTMRGGAGDDFIYYRAGDVISGGAGNDWAVATLSTSGVTLDLAARQFEQAWGSTSADTLSAGAATGTVVLVGDAGNDRLTGGAFGDFLYGLGDNDTLEGGGGNDNLSGGDGIDTFVFGANWGVDIVWDWVNSSEKFDMRGSGATSFASLAVVQDFFGSGNALISLGANQILVVGGANQIDAGDFLF